MATGLSLGGDLNPIGVRLLHVVVCRVRIGAGDHNHPELATPGHEIAEHVACTEPGAAVMQWNLRGIIRDTTAGAQADRVGFRALEVVEPELEIELARVVFDQRELRPSHRLVHPRRSGRGRDTEWLSGKRRRESELAE